MNFQLTGSVLGKCKLGRPILFYFTGRSALIKLTIIWAGHYFIVVI